MLMTTQLPSYARWIMNSRASSLSSTHRIETATISSFGRHFFIRPPEHSDIRGLPGLTRLGKSICRTDRDAQRGKDTHCSRVNMCCEHRCVNLRARASLQARELKG